MKKLRQLPEGPAEDRGATLILVLFVVLFIGVAGTALLTLTDTSIRATVALRDQAGSAYNADGAAQVAIDSLSTGYGFTSPHLFDNATGTTCFGSSGTLDLPDFYPATHGQTNPNADSSASVVCTADRDSGVDAGVVPSSGRPGQAIMTLGQRTGEGEDGINVKALNPRLPFSVKGKVTSNSNINVDLGTLQSTVGVTAFGGCSGNIVSIPPKDCLTSRSPVDPNYAFEPHFPTPLTDPLDVVPTYKAVPTICPGGVVTFDPGYYDDANALNDLMSNPGTCSGASTWWFRPGTYYFDFHNNFEDGDRLRHVTRSGSSEDQWKITRGTLVAGTPTDSSGSPGRSPTIPGSCQNPITSNTAQGVQFIFGGDSQLALDGTANAEICGTYSGDRPPIGVFGLKTGLAATPTTLTGSALPLSIVGTPPPRFVIASTPGTSATWVKTSSDSEASTVTVSGYAPPSAIPAGSIVKSATLRFTHGSPIPYTTTGTPSSRDSLALTFTPTGWTAPDPISVPPSLPSTGGLTTESLPLDASGSTTFAQFVHDKGFTGADMAYTATLKNPRDEIFTDIKLDIEYVAPAFRSQDTKMGTDPFHNTNCLTQAYTGGASGGCAVMSTSTSYSGAFYIQGTTYTPIAAIDLTLNRATQQVLRFGVISRSLWIKEVASFDSPGPVIEVPSMTTTREPVVLLTVYVCPAKTTSLCSEDPGAIKALQVKVMMRDPAVPLSKMTILSWSNLR